MTVLLGKEIELFSSLLYGVSDLYLKILVQLNRDLAENC